MSNSARSIRTVGSNPTPSAILILINRINGFSRLVWRVALTAWLTGIIKAVSFSVSKANLGSHGKIKGYRQLSDLTSPERRRGWVGWCGRECG
jgi:hypothetical protein